MRRKTNEEFKKKEEEFKKEREKLISMVDNTVKGAGNIATIFLSTINFAMKHFKNAPVLKKLDDYSIIHEDEEDPIEDIVIYKYKKKKLDKYLADKIIKHYKKDDPTKQATWNTDVDRCSYLIHDEIVNDDSDEENEITWVRDQKGKIFKEENLTSDVKIH